MSLQILTIQDLQNFKKDLLEEIQLIISQQQTTKKKWLRSKEVKEILNISPGTLQTYRINGTIKYSKIGKTIYYSLSDIEETLNKQSKN